MRRDLLVSVALAALVGAIASLSMPRAKAQLSEFEVNDLIVNGTVTGAAFDNEIRVFTGSCPSDWTEVTDARGRFLMGIPVGDSVEDTLGTAYTSSESVRLGGTGSGLTAGVLPTATFTPGTAPTINLDSGSSANRFTVSTQSWTESRFQLNAGGDKAPTTNGTVESTTLSISGGTPGSFSFSQGTLPSYADQAAPAPSFGVRFCEPS